MTSLHRRLRVRTLAAATLAAMTFAVAGCGHSAPRDGRSAATATKPATVSPQGTAAVPPPTRLLLLGQIGTRTDIPWPAVGVGWTLALAAMPHDPKQDLVIVAPG